MRAYGYAYGTPFLMFGGTSLGTTIALNHYNRVIAAGGVLPCGVAALASVLDGICTALSITSEAQFQTTVPEFLDPHYSGYLGGAGSGPTLGQACQKIFNLAGASGDVSQGAAGSMPLLLAYDGVNKYVWLPGVAGNYFSTPNAPANQITGDIEIISKRIKIKDYLGTYAIASKGDQGSNRGWVLRCSGGIMQFYFSQSGTGMVATTTSISLATAGYTADTEYYFKVSRNSTTGTVKYYGSSDGVTYSQIGTDVTANTGAMYNSTGQICIGAWNNDSNHFLGSIGGVSVSNTIGGAPVIDFNSNNYNASVSQTQFTTATGETYTLNVGTATTGLKACIVDRVITQYDGVGMFMNSATATRPDICSQYLAYKSENANGGGYPIIDSNSANYQNSFAPEAANMRLYMNNSLSGLGKTLGTSLTIWTSTNNQGVLNTLQKNNDTEASNTYTPALSGVGLKIGRAGSSAVYQKGIVNSYLCVNGINTTTQRTAMYSILRTMNNL